jgi:hypothetical protein
MANVDINTKKASLSDSIGKLLHCLVEANGSRQNLPTKSQI